MEITTVPLHQPFSSLDIYHSNSDRPLPGLVILPGGSYNRVSERDSERVAITFASHAMQTFVVRYPVVEHKNYHDAKQAVCQAFDYLVQHASELDLAADKLGIIGFSAGGQLAAAYSNSPTTNARFAALGYPVITTALDQHMGVQTEDVSQLVSSTTPPTFIWGSNKDQLTPFADHIWPYVQALNNKHVPFEFHQFATGGHGMALANKYTAIVNRQREDPHMALWLPLLLDWLHQLNILG
ncbi:alpha/beta hydrolase [uncultured Limosilactobacillus sp.]|uniref:alpha/beta hydrolase n=1 Tax=uncultured Limosilactobacillus sp. TaxID=2837629 RepID=UPI0025F38C8D|nr:alpha/beta hydrolase [uncultured Limosilactobacillus sp.]